MYDDVGEFHRKFDLPRYGDGAVPRLLDQGDQDFRVNFMREELAEYINACRAGDVSAAADAIADLVYVALGTGHLMRLPMDDVWREVQRANMTKVRASGADDPRSKRSHHLDVVKPEGFVPPDHGPAIREARMRAALPNLVVDESRGQPWWDDWFLGLARYAATASKDPSTRVGAVLVGVDTREVAYGYNGFPRGVRDDARLLDRATKYRYVVHAERNALDNARFSVDGGTLYCTCHPCLECAKSIASRRVGRVVVAGPLPAIESGRWTEQIPDAASLLEEAGIAVTVVAGG